MIGLFGCGKMCVVVYLIFEYMLLNWMFRKINCWEDLLLVNKDNRIVFLIDNMFLDSNMVLYFENWWEELV